MTTVDPMAEADRAAAVGDLSRAEELLLAHSSIEPGNADLWLRIAVLRRAAARPADALEAVEHALAASPLEFTALLMRASLLERLGDPATDKAWENALAQRPEGDLPEQVAAVVVRAERRLAQWRDEREARMIAACARSTADHEEAARIARFRSNILRRTRPFHSEPTDFHFSGIAEREFHPRRLFPWLTDLEAATDEISGELHTVMAAERAELVPYVQYAEHMPLRQWRALNHSRDWTAIHLWRNGRRIDTNARHCPMTLDVLESIGQPRIAGASPNAMFSLLAPGTTIPPHVGISNARLVCHLPLIVPHGCWFRVGAETRAWQRGTAFVFDDTIEHEAANPSDQLRVVLIFDIWHPDLTAAERAAVAAIIGAEGGSVAL